MKNYKLVLLLFFIILLFSSRLLSGIDNINVISSSSEFQSVHSWLPLIKSVKLGNFFPSLTNIDLSAQAFLFYPYLTLWLYGFMVWLIGMKGIVIVSTVVFPVFSFYLLYRIFSRQLNELWSITMSLTCILAFSDWPFRSFLFGIIKGLPVMGLTTTQPLEITHYPIPSFTVLIFLLVFYLSTENRKLTFARITIFTCLWGLYSQIHAVDALYGLAFWFIYFPIQFFKQSGRQLNNNYIRMIISQVIIVLLFLVPIIFFWKTSLVFNSVRDIGLIGSGPDTGMGLFYLLAYFIFPLTLTAIVFFVKKIDPYEILTRFIYVYIFMLVEFVLVTSSLFISKSFEIDVVQTRIALFFLHFYYYAPFIYQVTRPAGYTYSRGFEAKEIAKRIEHGMVFVFNRLDKIYLPLIIVFLFIFAGTSSYQSFIHYKDKEAPAMEEIMSEYHEISNILPEGNVLVSETPATNLLPPIDFNSSYKTLWINRFTHNLPSDDIIDRLLLYTHIYNWPKKKVIQFLSPGRLQERRGAIVDLSYNKIHESGVGYWLAHHKRRMGEAELNNYLSSLSYRYDNINIKDLLGDFGVTYIYSNGPISMDIPVKAVIELNKGFLYHVGF
jgi:hypothetical protein